MSTSTGKSSYFSEFKVLKHVSREFWLTNGVQFFDGMAYFSMITVLSLYLTTNCGFNDVDSGKWVGFFTLFVTAFMFAVGSICDVIGIKRSFFVGFGLLAVARIGLGIAPALLGGNALYFTLPAVNFLWLHGGPTIINVDVLKITVQSMLLIMALGTAFMSPVTMTALRRFTSKETRATGFNVYYLLMNIGAIIANALIVDGFRKGIHIGGITLFKGFGEAGGNLAIMDYGFIMALCAAACVVFMNENNFAEESERMAEGGNTKRPLAIFLEVWKEKAFQKLLLFLVLTIGVRLVFTNQFLVMPKYYTRVLTSDFELGLANAINPCIIVLGLIILIPVINRFSTVKLIIVGMAISASSLVVMAVPIQWIQAIPFIHNLQEAYLFMIITQILVFALGELVFSPRFTEYIASVSPPDKVSSYMALSALPAFISKPINGFVSGILISNYCYDGIRPKIETGSVPYEYSPEFMWMVYLILAVLSPIAVIATRKFITSKPEAATTAAPR